MNYQTFPPHPDLSPLVKCFWTLESPAEEIPLPQTIIPDGCMEMIFHYADPYKQYLETGETIIQPTCFVIGQLTRPLQIEPTGATGIFAVRFTHSGFLPFASNPIKEMANTAISLQSLLGQAGIEIGESILNAANTLQRIDLIESFLLKSLLNKETVDNIISSTVETILAAKGQMSVKELSKQTDINRRQLERKFAVAIGLSPKQLAKIVRLQTALKMLLSGRFTSFTALAYDGEYYDQAHFIKDFREFTGRTPKEFYHHSFKMSALFYREE